MINKKSKSAEFVCLNIKQSIFVAVVDNTYPCMYSIWSCYLLLILLHLIGLFFVYYTLTSWTTIKNDYCMLQILLYLIIAVCCSLNLVQRLTSNMLQHECRVTQSNWSSIWNHGNTCQHTNYAEAWYWIIRDAKWFFLVRLLSQRVMVMSRALCVTESEQVNNISLVHKEKLK